MRWRVLLLSFAFALPHCVAAADVSPVGISSVNTADLRLFYYAPLGYLVPHAVRSFTNALAWQRRMFGWTPSETTILLLQDRADYGNAATFTAPKDALVFDVAPQSFAYETYPASERMFTLMNHELVHVAQGDVASEQDRRWRRFFLGKVSAYSQFPETLLYAYLTVPRFVAPRWVAEGQAVFVETWMAGGLGRAQGGYDEMVFRAMVRDGAHFYDPLGLVSRGVQVDFQVMANAYLYGTRFTTWLAYAYSPEKVLEWIRRGEGSKRYYADQFEQVFGLPLDRAWQDWIAFERDFQERNLSEVRKFPITPHRDLVAHPLGSVSRTFYDEKTGLLYGGFKYPGVVEYVGAINTRDGSVEPLAEIKRSMFYRVTSFAFDPSTMTAFYTDDNRGDGSYRDLMAVNVKTGEQHMLLENGRIGEIVVNPVDKSLIGVRHENGVATLVRVPPPYNLWYQVHVFPYGVVPYDLDISPDGRLLSGSVAEIGGNQFLRVWDLQRVLNGDIQPLSQFGFGQSVPEGFTFSHDGRYLYGSSYYTGVSNIFRYEVSTGAIEAVSNAETGFFRPVPLADGRLVILNYTADGFVPAIIDPHPLTDISAIKFLGSEVVNKYPEVKTWQVAAPSTVDDEKLITSRGEYYPLRAVSPVNAFPTLQGYKNSIGLGYHANFLDPIQAVGAGITAAFTPDSKLHGNERAHIDLSGRYLGGWANLSWNRSDFYDLFGPTKRSRKGLAAKVGYDYQVIYDEPRFLAVRSELDYFDKIDTLPGAQNVGTPFTRLVTAKVGLYYSNLRRSLGAVDDEKGVGSSLIVQANHVSTETATQLHGTFDYGFVLPIPHSSLWLRSAAGISSGSRGNPVANFYFGGFGNNYVDSGEVKRYRIYDSMPGFKIDELSGQSFVRQLVEWNLPPIIFESVGTPALYLNWLRPAVFASGLWTDPVHSSERKNYQNLGTQCDLRFSVLHRYEMTLSAGYAVGMTSGRRSSDEWMISLKLL
jgi:hypothetical protein